MFYDWTECLMSVLGTTKHANFRRKPMHALSSERIATVLHARTHARTHTDTHTHRKRTANRDMKGWDLNMDLRCDLQASAVTDNAYRGNISL